MFRVAGQRYPAGQHKARITRALKRAGLLGLLWSMPNHGWSRGVWLELMRRVSGRTVTEQRAGCWNCAMYEGFLQRAVKPYIIPGRSGTRLSCNHKALQGLFVLKLGWRRNKSKYRQNYTAHMGDPKTAGHFSTFPLSIDSRQSVRIRTDVSAATGESAGMPHVPPIQPS